MVTKSAFRRSFVVSRCSDIDSIFVSSKVEQIGLTLGALDIPVSFSFAPLLDCLPARSHLDQDSFNIGLLCAKSPDNSHDFDFDRTTGLGLIYLGRTFERLDSGKTVANIYELMRLATLRMVGTMLELVPLGDNHIQPNCVMQPTHSPSDLAFLSGVSVPFCAQCQNHLFKSSLGSDR